VAERGTCGEEIAVSVVLQNHGKTHEIYPNYDNLAIMVGGGPGGEEIAVSVVL
jgi:hypothetical protein